MAEGLMKLEQRIAQLEAAAGFSNNDAALEERLQALETNSLKDSEEGSLIASLMEELDPKTALTYNASGGIAPLLYRQQEILASAQDHKTVLEQLQLISQLVISDPSHSNILVSTVLEPTDEYPAGLEKLEATLNEAQQRTRRLTARLDQILEKYEKTMLVLSEKLLLLQENEVLY
jgi:hypothetical protein